MFTPSPGSRATASGVTILVGGLVPFVVDMIPQARPGNDDSGMHMACPTCAKLGTAARMSQGFSCKADAAHGPFGMWEVETRCKELDDGRIVLVDPDEVLAAKVGDLPLKTLDLAIHPADTVTSVCRPGEKGYVLRPNKGTAKKVPAEAETAYGVLLALVERHPELAMVGAVRAAARSRDTYQLVAWNGQLALTEVLLPAELKDPDEVDIEVDETRFAKLEKLALSMVEDFDPARLHWDVKAAMAVLLEQAAAEADQPKPATPVFTGADIDAILDAALAARKVPA